ncbi:MAG: AraC family transcriptional regulator [Proteobacteria bacterium]|nr:AraC family transcriptional regulator [Pseudomonadota bacterium]
MPPGAAPAHGAVLSRVERENVMVPQTFSTQPLPVFEQLDGWRRWHRPTFEVRSSSPSSGGFLATNSNWNLEGLTVSRVCSPATSVSRPKSAIRCNSVDHRVISLSGLSASDVEVHDRSLAVPARVPVVLSLGEEIRVSHHEYDDRIQLFLSRDRFDGIGHILAAVKAASLPTAQGDFLADYMRLLERNLPTLAVADADRLPGAVEAMIAACLAPSADRVTTARHQIELTLMERVRKTVRENLFSPSLGPKRLCRDAAMSRSQLYRVLVSEGGVAHYIRRQRLSKSFAILCDASNAYPIARIAEMLCFADPSSFSRAFRQEFGLPPREVRAASLAGQTIAPSKATGVSSFSDSLHGF